MASVSSVRSAASTGEVADAQPMAARKRFGDFASRALDRSEQRLGAVPRSFTGPQTPVPDALVGERDRVAQVPAVRGTHRDRLPGGKGLSRAGAGGHDSEDREKPNHSECMITHGSA